MTLARTPYARLSPADIGQVDRELKKLEQMSAGLFVPKVLVAARSPYTVQGTDTMLLCDCTAGPITLTFPLAARVDGMCVQVVKSDTSTNAVTLSGTFSGVVNPTLVVAHAGFTVFAMNGAYHITALVTYPVVAGEPTVTSIAYPYGHVHRYGAVGGGIVDDTAAWNAALGWAPVVTAEALAYKVTGLQITGRAGVTLKTKGRSSTGTRLVWAGNATDALLRVWGCRDCTFEDFYILSSAAAPLQDAIRSETKSGSASTSNVYRNIVIEGTNAGGLQRGFAFIAGTGGDANNAENLFDNVVVNNYSDAAWDITHGQSANHAFLKCAYNANALGQIGVRSAAGVYYQWYGGGGGGNQAADYHTEGASASIVLQGVLSETSVKFLRTGASPSSVCPVSVRDCTYNCTNLGGDNRAIDFNLRGPLLLDNFCVIGPGTKATEIHFSASPNGTYMYQVRGGRIDTTRTDPFTGQHPQVEGAVFITPANTFRMSKTMNVASISGAAGSDNSGSNLRGSIDFTGATTALVVTFPTAEPDANYFLALSANAVGGAPPVAAGRATVSALTASQFIIILEAAPGVGNTMRVYWILVR